MHFCLDWYTYITSVSPWWYCLLYFVDIEPVSATLVPTLQLNADIFFASLAAIAYDFLQL